MGMLFDGAVGGWVGGLSEWVGCEWVGLAKTERKM